MQRISGKKTTGGKHITVKVYEEIKDIVKYLYGEDEILPLELRVHKNSKNIEWIYYNGASTPYKVTYI